MQPILSACINSHLFVISAICAIITGNGGCPRGGAGGPHRPGGLPVSGRLWGLPCLVPLSLLASFRCRRGLTGASWRACMARLGRSGLGGRLVRVKRLRRPASFGQSVIWPPRLGWRWPRVLSVAGRGLSLRSRARCSRLALSPALRLARSSKLSWPRGCPPPPLVVPCWRGGWVSCRPNRVFAWPGWVAGPLPGGCHV